MKNEDNVPKETDLVGRACQVAFDGASPSTTRVLPETIADIRITAYLGEGAMGTVYQGEQPTVHRNVAVKVIRSDKVTERRKQLFERETELLGGLHHPGIATLYEAGTWDDGQQERPYLAMELIQGQTLTDYAQEMGLGLRDRLELLAKVCEAIEHAHRNLVIHRDIKPSNVMVREDGEPVVLDFGIARIVRTEADTDAATATGTQGIVGTPYYMSPEQFEIGQANVDTRSDVYSLGVLAFQLLADRLPYEFKTNSIADVAKAISETEPRLLSQEDKRFKGDVSTIVAKALDKERDHRYQSAGAMAADIRRHLGGESIHARPATLAERSWRFCRRRPTTAILTALVLVLLLVLAVGGPIQAYRVGQAKDQADQAKNRAEARFGESRELLDYMTRIAANDLAGKEGVDQIRIEMLEEALAYHRDFVTKEPKWIRPLDLVAAHCQIGLLTYSLGRMPEANEAYSQALGLLDEALQRNPDDIALRQQLAKTHHNQANVLGSSYDLEGARRSLELATAQWTWLARREPNNLSWQVYLASSLTVTATQFQKEGDAVSASRTYAEAKEIFDAILQEHEEHHGVRRLSITLHLNMAHLCNDLGRWDEAKGLLDDALARNAVLRRVATAAQLLETEVNEAAIHTTLGVVLRNLDQPREAEQSYRKAIDTNRKMSSEAPGNPEWTNRLCLNLHNLANLLKAEGQWEKAADASDEASQLLRKLIEFRPNNLTWRRMLAECHIQTSLIRSGQDRPDLACDAVQESIELLEDIARQAPSDLRNRRSLRGAYFRNGKILYDLGHYQEASEAFAHAQRQHESLGDAYAIVEDQNANAEIRLIRARTLAALGENEAAIEFFVSAAGAWERIGRIGGTYNQACALALCAGLISEQKAADGYRARAIAALRSSVSEGLTDLGALKEDTDFDAIRDMPEFQTLLREVERSLQPTDRP